jgi:hypothetical protein
MVSRTVSTTLTDAGKKCIFEQGDYFERNVVSVIVVLCISQKGGDSENILKIPRIAV